MTRRAIGHESTALLWREFQTAWPRIDVQVDRHRLILAGGPEAFVMVRAVEQLFCWHEPDGSPPQTGLATAFQLFHRVLDVPQRDQAKSPEALWGDAAKFDHPVVVGAATHFLKLCVPHCIGGIAPAGVEHLRADAVVCQVLVPLIRVPTARAIMAAGGVAI